MARIKRYNSETGQWEYCNTGGMPIKGIDYLTKADYDTMRADMDAYLERNKESVGVTVSGNQGAEDVVGASVRIVGEDGAVMEEKTWNGTELVFRLEAGTVYHVEADATGQGFSSYKSETFTAVKGGARTVTAEVYAEKVNVSVEGIESGFAVTVKEEYMPCEYIEATGTQYIDTGFKPNNNTRVVMDFEIASTPGSSYSLFGGRDSSSAGMFNFAWHANGYFRSDYNKTATQQWAVGAVGRRTVDKNKETTTVDGVSNSYTNAEFTSSYNLYLFCLNNAGTVTWPSTARVYSCQIYDNGTLVRDYIPVMNNSGVYGLYDKVGGVFYSSATSTGFTGKAFDVEGLPSGYTECEYVESDGTNYVDTGFVPSSNARVVMDCLTTSTTSSSNRWLFGCNTSSTSARFELINIASDNSVRFYHGASNQTFSGVGLGKMSVDVSLSSASVNGTSITPTSSTFTGTNSILLCAGQTTGEVYGGMPMKVYFCQIYDGETLVRDYVPCKSNEGVFGLYDKVNGVFYASATSTGFTGSVKTKTFLELTEASGSCLVPYGTVYSVSAMAVDGYASPSSQTFTANVDSRNVVMTYEENLLGVFIEDINGKLWKTDAWDGSATPNGVALVTDAYAFVIALVDLNNTYYSWDNARSAITSYTFPNGQKGYIGTADEWGVAIANKDSIELALSSVDAPETETLYWTNTSVSTISATFVRWDLGYTGSAYKEEELYVRPFTTLKRDTN